eukprot:CAMPEP_0115014622 /NCGR_PEP_ID=MMETSP0216-20121206/26208_1 /TAXON_ID=223996 /ORGANISM="Protocruzia adherens, Strain Boccale" /LENGTH=120 /DNA_ID=CAMNT_0002384437 /DNA_START=41 /DNA_END=400 /DNA_ORIENTATION=+
MSNEEEKAQVADPNEEDTIFGKIARKEIPSTVVYEDDKTLAFRDIEPQAPVHIVIIPKEKDGLSQLIKAEERHKEILGHLMYVALWLPNKRNWKMATEWLSMRGKEGCQSVPSSPSSSYW